MLPQISRLTAILGVLCSTLMAQEALPPPTPVAEAPQGVEVLARGPVHEAFATPSVEPKATQPVPKKPPAPLEEMPPEEKPEGDVVWVPGYFAWDDDRQDFLWVSGCWRVKPAGKEWVPGYWREVGEQWQWVPGFWARLHDEQQQPVQVSYNPEPPAPPQIADPGPPPTPDMFYVPGYWMWLGDRYGWRAGYWTHVRPGYVYVASHYRWTPHGYVFVPGYWDLGVSRRGLLYAPVVVNPGMVGATFVYTPSYAVTDTIMLDALFVRPAHCHYYFGDYYGPRYSGLGFEACVVYGRRSYDPIIAYRRWEYRDNPRWLDIQIGVYHDRFAGRALVPPRAVVLAPARTVVLARGQTIVRLDPHARAQVRAASLATHQAMVQERHRLEPLGAHAAPPARPRVAGFNVPHATGARAVAPGAPGHPGAPNSALHPGAPGSAHAPGQPGAPGVTHMQPQGAPRPGQRPTEDRRKKAPPPP